MRSHFPAAWMLTRFAFEDLVFYLFFQTQLILLLMNTQTGTHMPRLPVVCMFAMCIGQKSLLDSRAPYQPYNGSNDLCEHNSVDPAVQHIQFQR